MEAYTGFAEVYDLFMDNVPYEEWAAYLVEILKEYHITEGILLDLGCGTGKMTRMMSDAGFDMIGVDNSAEMLQIARDRSCSNQVLKGGATPRDILYLLQDMREFELYGTVRGVYCACDCLNYLLEEEDLLQVFRLVNNYLDPEGIFIFDVNTPYKYKELLGDCTFAENREEGSFIWENFYDEEASINEYDLTLFIRETGCDHFLRFQEVHYQKCYTETEIERLIQQAGMELLAVYDGYTKNAPHAESEKYTFIVREKGK